ncbi:MAG: sulfite exporter TauE/SafE family protein [Candidatus Latescibacteria bacterium]|jgi:uncharacterized protein|nr:sulfite exporter TauE/SafE family protein [Candidatus Latescibacterota bacterium]
MSVKFGVVVCDFVFYILQSVRYIDVLLIGFWGRWWLIGALLDSMTLLLALGGFLVGVMRAGFGGGVGVVAAPIMALVIPAKLTLGVILPLSLATDVISVRYYWGHWVGQHVRALLPGMIVGVLLGGGILDVIPEEWFRRILGALACVFAFLQVFKDRILSDVKPLGFGARVGVGIVLGVVSSLVHAGGVVLMLYLLPQGLSGRTFVATAWLFGVILNAMKLVLYLSLGIINSQSLMMDVWLLPVLALGALVGIVMNKHLSPLWFNRIVLVLVLGIGFKLMVS